MAAIRITIGDMPPLLRSLVKGMLDQNPQFEIIPGDTSGETAAEGAAGVDVLVVSETAMSRLLPHPGAWSGKQRLGIVAIAPDGLDAAVVRLCAHRTSLDGGPRRTLSQAIVEAAGTAGGAA